MEHLGTDGQMIYNGQAYLFSSSKTSGFIDRSNALVNEEHPLISKLISRSGSKVLDVQ